MAKNNHVPTQVKNLRGTYRKDRDNKGINNVPVVLDIPDPPETYTVEQSEMFISIVKYLYKIKALQDVGLPIIHAYCIQYGIYIEAHSLIKPKNGVTSLTITSLNKSGTVTKKNPAIDIMNAALNSMIAISDRFGFTPLAQGKIHIPKDEEVKKGSKFDI
jgi:P27 family predicted phage terminase small subunit